ncbi:MAG: HXXEE domain-containing protein [Candidatus Andersenbacteria bacterium]
MKHAPSVIFAGVFSLAITIFILLYVGIQPAVIIGGSAIIAFFVWLSTTYHRPVSPGKIVPMYLLALTGQIIHTGEEYIADFPGHLSGLFHLHNFDRNTFALAVLIFAVAVWVLTAYGLLKRSALANYFLWFFLIGPGIVNGIAHIAFPVIMRQLYFPGLVTVIIPTILSIVIIRKILARA